MRFGTDVNLFERQYLRVYLIIVVAALLLLLVQWVTSANFFVSIALAGIVSLIVFRLNRHALNVEETFPELLRLPLMPWLFGKKKETV